MSGRVDFRDRRALVLGASGFIGRWVVASLERAGCRVTAWVRDPAAAREAFAMSGAAPEPLVADLSDLDEIDRVVLDVRPHLTVNLAGYGVDRSERDPEIARRINADVPTRLADAVLDLASRKSTSDAARDWEPPILIHAGSALEYGVADRVGEDDRAEPTTDYGRTKLAGTLAVSAAVERGLRACTARLFTVYGPGEHPGRLLPSLLEEVGTGRPIELTEGLQKRDFTYIDDVVEGLLRLAGCRRPPELANLATGQLKTVRQFVESAAHELHLEPDQLRFGARPGLVEEMEHAPVPVARLREAVGWVPEITIAEGVRRTVKVLGIEERAV